MEVSQTVKLLGNEYENFPIKHQVVCE